MKYTAFVLALVVALSIVGCADRSNNNPITGSDEVLVPSAPEEGTIKFDQEVVAAGSNKTYRVSGKILYSYNILQDLLNQNPEFEYKALVTATIEDVNDPQRVFNKTETISQRDNMDAVKSTSQVIAISGMTNGYLTLYFDVDGRFFLTGLELGEGNGYQPSWQGKP